jgi:hypothetical protein
MIFRPRVCGMPDAPRRGVMMQLPSGQDVARAMRIVPLAPKQIAVGPDGEIAAKHGFDRRTPLWYYILKEAEVEGGGIRLGQVGSRIIAKVFVGLLEGDPESYLAQCRHWRPFVPAAEEGCFTMVDMVQFVDDINPIEQPAG